MSIILRQRFCRNCGRKTLHQKETFSLGFGCLLTILTGGLFIPIWLLVDILGMFSPFRCQQCGGGKFL